VVECINRLLLFLGKGLFQTEIALLQFCWEYLDLKFFSGYIHNVKRKETVWQICGMI